ncbi:ATP synthase subunit a [Neptunitalea chrysea]|uniref:ATP synthase subunit a n=2 Tax=Neptunitalea chrysea TaxID=1647581 RepID=A0A9W6EWF3_9FLAO|nr:ATP synthase subunit a [Neptunitalea chrysea]
MFTSILGFSQEHHEAEKKADTEEEFDATELIMHHISDAHEFHVADINGESISFPLPVILWTDNGLVTFMSSEFHHDNTGEHVVEKNGMKFVRLHEEIYYANKHGGITLNEEHHAENRRPLNFSITKNVFSLFLAAALMLLIFIPTARSYKKGNGVMPKGIGRFMEPLILFVRDDIAKPNIGEKKYKAYMPYLLTVFFLIWIGNIFGLIPFFPFSGTLTNDILFTGVMAAITFLITQFSGNKEYWGHIFWMPGIPVPMKIIMAPIELIGIFTKPFALMIRLFANITAGHIIILSLFSLIFIFGTAWVSPVSVGFALFMNVLELLVAALQAYVFTLLSALFIGQAVAEHDHH